MLKKLLASLLLFSLAFVLAAPITFAQEKTGLAKLAEIYCDKRKGNQVNLETWYGGKCDPDNPFNPATIGFGDIIIIDLYTKLSGEGDFGELDWGEILKNLVDGGYKSKDQIIADLNKAEKLTDKGGAMASLSGIIGTMLSTPPASAKDYLNYVAGNIRRVNPVQPAYAQGTTGFGFQSIQAVLPIWRAFRNVTYLVFVLVFVVYGFMIMFRVKINPQTTANIQSILPKIALVLLTITFSYAIVGLAIDLSYVVTGVIWSILKQANIIGDYSGVFGTDFLAIKDGFAKFVSGQTWGLAGPMVAMLGHFLSFDLTGRVLAAFMPGFIAGIVAIPANFIIGLIILIAAFFTLLRIAWMLLKAYINLILATIFAPLMLLPGVLPGNNAFSGWLRGVIAELSIFVATTMGLLFAFYFLGPITVPVIQRPLFSVGPLDTSRGMLIPPPLAGGGVGTTEGRFALLGIGLFFIIPAFADKIRKALQAPILDFGTELGKALQYGWGQYTNPRSLYNKSPFAPQIGGALDTVTGTAARWGSAILNRPVTLPKADQIRDKLRETQIRGRP